MDFAVATVREYTPVDTGRLKAGWQRHGNWLEGSVGIANFVPYAPYVEFGTEKMAAKRMMQKSIPEIETQLERYLNEEVRLQVEAFR